MSFFSSFKKSLDNPPQQNDTGLKVAIYLLICIPLGMLTGLLCILEVPFMFFNAWTLHKIWNWYGMAQLGLPELQTSLAFGILISLMVIKHVIRTYETEDDSDLVGTLETSNTLPEPLNSGIRAQMNFKKAGTLKNGKTRLLNALENEAKRATMIATILVIAWFGTLFL